MTIGESDRPERAPHLFGTATVAQAATAGALNAVTFFAMNGVFASTVTGNLIFLGLDVARGRWADTIEAVCAIGGYIAGLAVGTLVAGAVMRHLPWRSALAGTLGVELAVLLLSGVGWYGLDGVPTLRAVLLVVGASVAMGMQGAVMRYAGPAGTPTNYLTGTLTNLVSAGTELHNPRWDWYAALRLLAMVAGAGAGAYVYEVAPAATYVLPVALLALAVALTVRVVVVNHGGLLRGRPELAPRRDDQVAVPSS